MRTKMLFALVFVGTAAGAQQPNPRQLPGAQVTMFAPEQHDLYDRAFLRDGNDVEVTAT